MGNLGGPEVIVIMLVALMVLGPDKLPEAVRQVGKAMSQLRRISSGFQQEMREAMIDPVIEAEAREMGKQITGRPIPGPRVTGSQPPKAPPVLSVDPTPPPDEPPSDSDS